MVEVLALLGFFLLLGLPVIVVVLLVKGRQKVVPRLHDADPGWHRDPLGRHELRYWDGDQWTDEVSDGDAILSDPLPDD